jgi:Sulfotransferase family
MQRVKILYVVGPTRSGSTLLARLLNECSGIVSVGEVVSLDVALQSSRVQARARGQADATFVPYDAAGDAARRFSALCGCNLPLHTCPIWARVEADVFGDPPDYSRWSWDARRPSLGRFLFESPSGWLRRDGRALGEVAESVYRELARLTHARVIVDDSKTPLYGYFLTNQPWADVVPVRLVRDPRGTAASWRRPKSYPGIEGGHLPSHSAAVASVDWLKRVLLADRLFSTSALVRYEDLAAAPMPTVRRLLDAAGIEVEPMGQGRAETAVFGTNHILAGNPDKFERGEVGIRPPSDWSHVLGRGARMMVTAVTLPLLRRYGYALWNGRRP